MTITSNDTQHATNTIAIHLTTVANDDDTTIPVVTALQGNYPNPFNPVTTIRFAAKDSGRMSLLVYNTKGQLVRTLVNGDVKAGNHSIVWNGKDDNGKPVSSGVYMYRMQTTGYSKTQKMMLMK
jgi:flagellar hook assembly protein FlgD